jgi:hypothetical protein
VATFIATFVLIVGGGLFALPTSASAVACYYYGPDLDPSAWRATANGANMRVGASTSCAISGVARAGHRLDYHCYTAVNSGGGTWTYLRNDTTGIVGWVRDDLLSDNGSSVYCGFNV